MKPFPFRVSDLADVFFCLSLGTGLVYVIQYNPNIVYGIIVGLLKAFMDIFIMLILLLKPDMGKASISYLALGGYYFYKLFLTEKYRQSISSPWSPLMLFLAARSVLMIVEQSLASTLESPIALTANLTSKNFFDQLLSGHYLPLAIFIFFQLPAVITKKIGLKKSAWAYCFAVSSISACARKSR